MMSMRPLLLTLSVVIVALVAHESMAQSPLPRSRPADPATSAASPPESLSDVQLDSTLLPLFAPGSEATAPVQLTPPQGTALGPLNRMPDGNAAVESGGSAFDIYLTAQLTDDSPPISEGVSWRVFGTMPGGNGELPLLATATGGSVTMSMPKGEYLVHGSYGRAGGTKRIAVVDGPQTQTFVLNAGGLRLSAVVGEDQHVDTDQITFEISQDDTYGARSIVLPRVEAGKIIRLSAGTYHVVSRYGFVNAVVRADIEVYAGKLTDATIRHKGAEATLKLVEKEGGEALANTSWTVLTEAGDTLHQSVGAFPTIILAEGTYTAVARHKNRTFARDFTIQPGLNRDVEVRLQDVIIQTEDNNG